MVSGHRGHDSSSPPPSDSRDSFDYWQQNYQRSDYNHDDRLTLPSDNSIHDHQSDGDRERDYDPYGVFRSLAFKVSKSTPPPNFI